ncbi:MAG: alpha/beta hydrolase family protein [Bradyrhizobium sp.]|uniref:alpha/beta hydrolase family protein n=1 Tax=Bradyrhizobium sp. TaxID=376 RepID=UPI003D129DDF
MNLRVDVSGWMFSPDCDDEQGLEFARLLASAQDGGATVAECLQVASRIVEGDKASWHREWRRLAEASADRAEQALADGSRVTAASNWLRAINYYLASIHLFDTSDRRCPMVIEAMRKCAASYLRHAPAGGEIISIPWIEGRTLQAYLLQPAESRSASPMVICVGEPGHRKEEYLFKLARHAGERGLALLALDLWGEGSEDCGAEVIAHPEITTIFSRVLDHLSERNDIDLSRIAVLADGWGSSFVARGIAAEPRIAAAACDGGLWDFHQRRFLARRAAGRGMDVYPDVFVSRVARNIECPLLITLGERGWLKAEQAEEFVDRMRSDGRDVSLRLFTSAETASEQGHSDNPTLANEFIFDWLSARLGQILAACQASARH